jgi:hypothetical protein
MSRIESFHHESRGNETAGHHDYRDELLHPRIRPIRISIKTCKSLILDALGQHIH